MAIKVKAVERQLKVGKDAGKYQHSYRSLSTPPCHVDQALARGDIS